MKRIQTNPFIIGAYAGNHYFCDRRYSVCNHSPMKRSYTI